MFKILNFKKIFSVINIIGTVFIAHYAYADTTTTPTLNRLSEVRITGILAAEPCLVRPGDEEIQVNFGSIGNKDLYNQIKKTEPFIIHLDSCDTSIAKSVKVTFSGTATTSGLLQLNANSSASGVGIRILDTNGTAVVLNQPTKEQALIDGSNELQYTAYVQAEDDALNNKSIGLGDFNASATFELAYE